MEYGRRIIRLGRHYNKSTDEIVKALDKFEELQIVYGWSAYEAYCYVKREILKIKD